MSLSPEDREKVRKAVTDYFLPNAHPQAHVDSFDIRKSRCIGVLDAIDRALSPDPMPKPGQIVEYTVGGLKHFGTNVTNLNKCEPWRVIVTAEECLEALGGLTVSYYLDVERRAVDRTLEAVRERIRRLINEAPRSK